MKFYQEELLEMDFIHLGQFLSKLPDDIPAASLFQAIGSINLMEQKFIQTLAMQKEVAAQIKSVSQSTKWKNIKNNFLTVYLPVMLSVWNIFYDCFIHAQSPDKLNIVIFKPDLSLGCMVKSFPLYRLGTIALEPIVSFPSPST